MVGRSESLGGARRAAIGLTLAWTLAVSGCGDDADRDGGELLTAAAVRVEAEGCRTRPTIGAGSFVDDHRVLTVAHVVAGSTDIEVTLADGTEVDAQVVAIDRAKDLALLDVDADVDPLPLSTLRTGDRGQFVVWRDDAPEVRPFAATSFVDINASDIDRTGSGLRKGFQIEAEVANGDSGSVLVHEGRAVAVVFARSTGDDDRAWATDIREAFPLLRRDDDRDPDDVVDVGSCAGG